MRVALSSDAPVIGRTLSDLLTRLRYEVVTSGGDGIPQLNYSKGALQLIGPDGEILPVEQPVRLNRLAQLLRQLQTSARGNPLALANGWRLEPLARMLHSDAGQHVPLTEKESLLLAALYRALPDAAGREQLLKDVWAYAGDSETHTLETHIYRLRSKLSELKPPPADIVTSDGTYRLVID